MADIIVKDSGAPITQGASVTLHFSLLLPSGEEIDSTRNSQPATFTVGDGSLLPGFEATLIGKTAGFAEQILVPASEAFGEPNPSNVQSIEKTRFEQMVGVDELEEGLIVSFQAPDGELPGVVKAIYETNVLVDFNHPLSGTDIIFDVAILGVEAPASEEDASSN